MNLPSIAIACDHAGLDLKKQILTWLNEQSAVVRDFGTNSIKSVDYPDFARLVSNTVEEGECEIGILICGTGIGMSIAANRFPGIRAALCWNSESARLAKSHNNANVICLPGRLIDPDLAIEVLVGFFSAGFEGGRHQRRIDKLGC